MKQMLSIGLVIITLGSLSCWAADTPTPRIVQPIIDEDTLARRTKAEADIKVIEDALELFKADNGHYPTTAEGLQALLQPTKAHNKPHGYLDKMPVDPWGNRYAYFSDGADFVIKSYGADGHEGGEGKNADIDSRALP